MSGNTEEPEPLFARSAQQVCQVQLLFPSPAQRRRLLLDALERRGATVGPDVDVWVAARRYPLEAARLHLAARAAHRMAQRAQPGERRPTVGRAELEAALGQQLRHDLKSVAVRVTATHSWDDLIIPDEVAEGLREMVRYLRNGERVYDHWGFGERVASAQGVSALFSGPPGTGKTMCAAVLARELDMELFRVDLARVISKWMGETEKNLARVFDEAQRSNAIVLFDEADSLFARRTEVRSSHDRYANLEVNYLLQRVEAFGGVTILTTNYEDTIDAAFKRRLTFRLRFEKPDAASRAALWRRMFPPRCPLASDVDFARLGARFDMSGGNIRNAALRAAFLASELTRPIDMEVCERAAERESTEMGQLTRTQKSAK